MSKVSDIRVGSVYSNSKGINRSVVDKTTFYSESANSPRRCLISYVVLGGGSKVRSCYLPSFLRWVNS